MTVCANGTEGCTWDHPTPGEKCEHDDNHAMHGRESPEETPNLTHCPCVGHGVERQRACAEAGCGYCGLMTETPDEIAQKLVMLVGRKTAMALCAIAPAAVDNDKAVVAGVTDANQALFQLRKIACNTGPKPDYEVDPLVSMIRAAFVPNEGPIKEAARLFLEWFETYDQDQGDAFDNGGREARDALKKALRQEDVAHAYLGGQRGVLREVAIALRMPEDPDPTTYPSIREIVAHVKLSKRQDAPIIFAALAAMVKDVHAPQDQLTEDQWKRAEEIFNELNTPDVSEAVALLEGCERDAQRMAQEERASEDDLGPSRTEAMARECPFCLAQPGDECVGRVLHASRLRPPACPVCRGRKVIQGAFEKPCTNCKGTGISPQLPRPADADEEKKTSE